MTTPEQPTPQAIAQALEDYGANKDDWDALFEHEKPRVIERALRYDRFAAQRASEAVAVLRCAACDGPYPNPDCPHLRNARDMGERIPCAPAQAATPPPGDAELNCGETTMMGTGRYPYRKGFHWKDNWYFTRLPHGVVAIAKFASPEAEDPEFEIKIPAEQWASIMSSVSSFGETSVRYQEALDFHGAHD